MIEHPLRTLHTVATVWVATTALAQLPFALDTTFRTQIQRQYVNSIMPLPDGGLIASGIMRFVDEFDDYRLVQLSASGQRDETFNNSGLGGGKIVPWQNKLYVAGTYVIRRVLLPSGQNDASFAFGTISLPEFSPLQPGDYHVYPDGRVLISGRNTLYDATHGFEGEYNLIWFTNTGYLDTTRNHRRGNGVVYRFKELPNGQFICSGTCSQFEGAPVDRIFRVNADGTTDTTFHTGVYTGIVGGYLPMDDGRVYVSGRFRRSAAPADTLYLVRFMPDGSLDPTFSIPQLGLGAFPVDFGKGISFLYPWDDGKFIATGQFHYVNGTPRSGICMFDSTGQVLDVFNECGVGAYTDQSFSYATVEFVARDTVNDVLYICGQYNGYTDGTTNDTLQRFITRLHVGDITTGTSASSAEPHFALYPNPSSGNVTLQLEQVPRSAQVVVRDALGREVLRRRITDHYTTVAIERSGVYILELWDGQGRIAMERLVVE